MILYDKDPSPNNTINVALRVIVKVNKISLKPNPILKRMQWMHSTTHLLFGPSWFDITNRAQFDKSINHVLSDIVIIIAN
jgi:hypothetical protein